MRFSICIANYNNGEFLSQAVESVLNQSFSDFEIIIVDDCSTDDSIQIAERLKQEDSRIKISLNDSNQGVGYTKKRCLDLAQGEICGFLDPDDALACSDALEKMADAHDDPTTCIVYSNQIQCNDELEPTGLISERILPENLSLLEAGGSLTHFVTFKRDCYRRTEGLSSAFKKAIDIDLYLKLEEVGSIQHLPEPLYLYRQHQGGISQGENEKLACLWSLMARWEACRRRRLPPEFILRQFVQKEMPAFPSPSLACRIANKFKRLLTSR